MSRLRATLIALSMSATLFYVCGAGAEAKELTLCWAAWDPANALVELSKDFTAQSGTQMKFEFVPWTSYADRFINELNSHGKLCDLIIGDSQWIGGSAENGHYVKLNDFFTKNHISMNDFMPATVLGYAEWPKNTPNYWALPAMADAVGWTYRKDWFAKPALRAEFQKKYGRELAPPKTWDQLKQTAEFFQGRTIDGKKRYGAYIFTERGSEGITMGATNALYNFGFTYENPKKPYQMDGFVNSAGAVKGLEAYKALYKCCTAPGMTNAYMQEGLDAFKSGQVAMQMNWFAFFPGLYKDPNVGAPRSASSRIQAKADTGPNSEAKVFRSCLIRITATMRWRTSSGSRSLRAEKVVEAGWLLRFQSRGTRPKLSEERAVCTRLSRVDGNSQRLLGGTVLCGALTRHAEAPSRLRRRR